jgi:hypothetical protein
MNLKESKSGDRWEPELDGFADPALEQALANFRQSVYAWSEAAYNRPRTVAPAVVHRSWRLAVGCALGCVLAAGSLTGGLYERHHRQVVAKMKADQEARQQAQAARARTGNTDEDLLADVDSDISRAVPAAMEPLAQLMDGEDQ